MLKNIILKKSPRPSTHTAPRHETVCHVICECKELQFSKKYDLMRAINVFLMDIKLTFGVFVSICYIFLQFAQF